MTAIPIVSHFETLPQKIKQGQNDAVRLELGLFIPVTSVMMVKTMPIMERSYIPEKECTGSYTFS